MISSCCGAQNRVIDYDSGIDCEDMGICPDCREHCEFLSEGDFENQFNGSFDSEPLAESRHTAQS